MKQPIKNSPIIHPKWPKKSGKDRFYQASVGQGLSYHQQRLRSFYAVHVPPHSSVLLINSGDGSLLEHLNPVWGVGVEAHEQLRNYAQNHFPDYLFVSSLESISSSTRFDYIVMLGVVNQVDDIHQLFEKLHPYCHPGTRIIIDAYTALWAPFYWIARRLGRQSVAVRQWVSIHDIKNMAYLAGFDAVTSGYHTLMARHIPFISTLFNAIVARLPIIRRLCMHQWLVIRPTRTVASSQTTVSIVIPCRNEAGNIESAVLRCPQLGSKTEIIFVEGHSSDDTLATIERVAQKYPEKNISWYVQPGKGKGDAVRTGFAHATGDVLMIQDGDLTAAPEELPQFFNALTSGKGEFINGSRLIYGMEQQAMMFLALISNHMFSWILSWIMAQRITDTLCGTKVLWKKDYERIALHRHAIGLHDPYGDFDLLFGAARLHLKIVDVPVHYKDRTYGSTNINRFKDVWFLLWMCARACWFLKLV